MSRLDYAPKLKEIEITDIKKGIGVFQPKPGRPVSFAALKNALRKAGYALDSADITVSGALARDAKGWWLVAGPTGQRFALEGPEVEKLLRGVEAAARVEVTGDWKTVGAGASAREIISPRDVKREGKTTDAAAVMKYANVWTKANSASADATVESVPAVAVGSAPAVRFTRARFDAPGETPFRVSPSGPPGASPFAAAAPASPIRATSPGLTVYKGGALTPRLYLIKQHLGGLEVSRQVAQLGASYTPTPRTQFEIEVPFMRTSFRDAGGSGSGAGLGNVTLWGKYRFFRKVKTYGDRQASARFGLELPTGKNDAPSEGELDAPAFVRQQLTPVSGGLSAHLDLSFSQAGGRVIFGGNVEAVVRSEREGFRTGHELRVNTDLEYVLLPREYERPGGELFVIFETSFVRRGAGRLGGAGVAGSESTEYYVAPGLQYAAHPQLVIEGSVQLPLVRNTGPLVLRTDRNILAGVKYFF